MGGIFVNMDVEQVEVPVCVDTDTKEVPITPKESRQKYRVVLDYSREMRDYFDLVIRHVLKDRYVIPSLEICDPQDMPYGGLCDYLDDTIYIVNRAFFKPVVHHELAHYVYYHSGSQGFTERKACGRHDVVFACTCAAFHLFMKRDAGCVPKPVPRLPQPDGVTYMSAYDVWEETDAPLAEFNGLLFVRVFYDCLRYKKGNCSPPRASRFVLM
jgi:hypothetical protein